MRSTILIFLMLFSASFSFAQNKNMVLRSHLPYPGKQLSNIGGWADAQGNEYALVGTSDGLSIVDVTDPDNIFEIVEIPGPQSIWREVKTWQHYAYVTTEGGSDGLQIIDLSGLPSPNLAVQQWTPFVPVGGTGQTLATIHALHIDNGFVYLYGSNNINTTCGGIDGIVIGDLSDPWNPSVAGVYNGAYVHDGYVRNDTVWAGRIYDGDFAVIDVSDKANPVVLATQATPSNFTHNTWLSDNSKYLFTTDEVDNSYLAVYDVEDISNIQEIDKIQSQFPGGNSVVHNTHILNDYAVTSWYTDGVVITDGHRPQNLVNVGWFDTSPLTGGGYNGCWGVYPYLPSGTVVASDMQEGLFVLTPAYVRACYLEGTVIDSSCGTPIFGAQISIQQAGVTENTSINGDYATGTPDAGIYDIVVSKPGYLSQTVSGVDLQNGLVTVLNFQLTPIASVNLAGLVNNPDGIPVNLANVNLSNANNSFNYVSNPNGEFNQCGFVSGLYNYLVGKWGYITQCGTVDISNPDLEFELVEGVYDDFSFANGWTVSGNASAGFWTRAIPLPTFFNNIPANPGSDVNNDCSDKAFVTGNNNANVGIDDVDDGSTILTSPPFDLSGFSHPVVKYSRWFFNGGGTGTPNDSLVISITNGVQTVPLEIVLGPTAGVPTWVERTYPIKDLLPITSNMRMIVRAVDAEPGHLVEAGFDYFRVINDSTLSINQLAGADGVNAYPNPSLSGESVTLQSMSTGIVSVMIYDVTGRMVYNEPSITSGKNNYTLHANSLKEAGVYFYQLQLQNQQIKTGKLIIKK
jgi:choice-of-anchor B domain-containing protein